MSQIDATAHDGVALPPAHAGNANAAVALSSASTLQRCHAAFLQELPALLSQHGGQWAAYAGDKRVAIGPSKRELFRQCLAAGHSPEEILICGIEQPRENVLDEPLEV
jgi:hypothetical protein